jgi:hypothetical protein
VLIRQFNVYQSYYAFVKLSFFLLLGEDKKAILVMQYLKRLDNIGKNFEPPKNTTLAAYECINVTKDALILLNSFDCSLF